MTDNTNLACMQTKNTEQTLNVAIHYRFPEAYLEQVVTIRKRLVKHIVDTLTQGYDLASVRKEGDPFILKILRVVKQEAT